MAERSYPPVGDPDRFDSIVSRGRSMRRRRQATTGVGAAGIVAVVAAGVMVVAGSGGNEGGVIADGPTEDPTTTTAAPDTTPAPPAPEEMTVSVDPGPDRTTIVVADPEQIAVDDANQCVVVTILDESGDEVANGHGCNLGPGDQPSSEVSVDPVSPELAISACAPQVTRADPDEEPPTSTRPATSTFEFDTPPLEPGEHTVTVAAVSGRGDGCPGTSDESTEIETTVEASAPLTVP